jgi:nucleoside-diphosphate-sugar epimerase
MDLLRDALRAGHPSTPLKPGTTRRVIVAGGAGVLGGAVLEQLLGCGGFAQVGVLVTQPLGTALRGLVPVMFDRLGDSPPATAEDTALIVFDRVRHANGREEAFLRPEPPQLPALAAELRQRGVHHLVVVMPHAPASLPDALKLGLANLDEQAVAGLGFDHLLFIRSAQAAGGVRAGQALQRLADWLLSQLQIMVTVRNMPVRASKVAQFAAQLALQLPQTSAGTRVVPPELVWEAGQTKDIAGLAGDWLHQRERGPSSVPKLRM